MTTNVHPDEIIAEEYTKSVMNTQASIYSTNTSNFVSSSYSVYMDTEHAKGKVEAYKEIIDMLLKANGNPIFYVSFDHGWFVVSEGERFGPFGNRDAAWNLALYLGKAGKESEVIFVTKEIN